MEVSVVQDRGNIALERCKEKGIPEAIAPEASFLAALLEQDAETSGASSGRPSGPLLWINQRFDYATMFLGGVGSMLRSYAGRMLLGLVGLALLAGAAGWVLKDWLGWNWP